MLVSYLSNRLFVSWFPFAFLLFSVGEHFQRAAFGGKHVSSNMFYPKGVMLTWAHEPQMIALSDYMSILDKAPRPGHPDFAEAS